MAKLKYHESGTKRYFDGVDRGVLAVKDKTGKYGTPVAWQGLTSWKENNEGGDSNKLKADNLDYINLHSKVSHGGSIGCYTYPDEFAPCMGERVTNGFHARQQSFRDFGAIYRTKIGDDIEGTNAGCIYHFVWNASCNVYNPEHQTETDDPNAEELSFDYSCTDEEVTAIDPETGKPYRPMACMDVWSTDLTLEQLKQFEDYFYGTDGEGVDAGTEPHFPENPDALIAYMKTIVTA